jgi:hypothetical protein
VVIAFVGNHFLPASPDAGGFADHSAAIGIPQAAAAGNEDCKVPDWAIAMGHADKWKLHHNCK